MKINALEALDPDKRPIKGFKAKPTIWFDADRSRYLVRSPVITAGEDVIVFGFRVHTNGGTYDYVSPQYNVMKGGTLLLTIEIPTDMPLSVIDAKQWCRWKNRMVEE